MPTDPGSRQPAPPTSPAAPQPPASNRPAADPTPTGYTWPANIADIAIKAAQDRKVKSTPPAGYESGPAYDEWYRNWAVAWFKAGVAAGDADLMRRAGIKNVSEGGGEKDLIAPWENATPSSEWLGKRAPTAPELRRYYRDSKKTEDFARFPDRVLAAWIKSHWQVKEGHFVNDFGDVVEKPTESGPKSDAAGYPTGLKSGGEGGGGGGGGGGGKPGEEDDPSKANPLTNALLKQWLKDAGLFADDATEGNREVAVALPEGALWWGEQATAPAAAPPPGSSAAPPAERTGGAGAAGAAATPTFFGATSTGGNLPTAPAAPAPPAPPTSPASPAPQAPVDFTKTFIGKQNRNPLVEALVGAAFPKLPR